MANHKVLIVDDDSSIRDFLKASLCSEGYELFEAENGAEGLKAFQKYLPSVVISDINMPDMDGDGLVRALAPRPDSDFAVIIMTGMSSDEAIRKFYQLGVSAFLPKPLNLHQIRGLVRHLDNLINAKIEINRYQQKLETMVEARTEALQKTLRELKKANLAKDNFLAKMSHEIRTPLNAILGLIEIMEDRSIGKKCQNCSKEIIELKSSASFLASLIGDVLDMSKIASGTMELTETPVDFVSLIDDSLAPFRLQTASKGLYLKLDISPHIPRHVWCDTIKIRQIILNLVSNAIKFTSHGGISVSIFPAIDEPFKQNCQKNLPLCIQVTDTGAGISSDDVSRIFKPFEQADKCHGVGLGTGLGLSIVKGIAKLMGGSASAKSTIGQGSVFSVTICLRQAEPSDLTMHDKEGDVSIKSGRALIVDDVAINRTVVAFQLQKKGWRIAEVESGEACLELLKQDSEFDVILMDISMPGMGGVECTARIKADKRLRHLPVIALTAHAVDGDRRKFLASGMDGYVAKPLNPDRFWQEITYVLSNRDTLSQTEQNQWAITAQTEASVHQDPPKETPPLELNQLENDICQGSSELVKELLKTLLQSLPQWLSEAEEAVNTQDGDRIRKVCHLIRGTASTITAYPLHDMAVLLGNMVKAGRMEETPEGLEQLKKAGMELEDYTKKILESP